VCSIARHVAHQFSTKRTLPRFKRFDWRRLVGSKQRGCHLDTLKREVRAGNSLTRRSSAWPLKLATVVHDLHERGTNGAWLAANYDVTTAQVQKAIGQPLAGGVAMQTAVRVVQRDAGFLKAAWIVSLRGLATLYRVFASPRRRRGPSAAVSRCKAARSSSMMGTLTAVPPGMDEHCVPKLHLTNLGRVVVERRNSSADARPC
jgi:hypothetical protein